MSVYKLIPSHYIKLHGDKPLPSPPCTAEQFENLKLLLRTSNSKLTSLAETIKELRCQLREKDAIIADLTARSTVSVSNRVEVSQPQDVVVDVTNDLQVRLKVELVDQGKAPPLLKVASTVVTRRPATPASASASAAKKDDVGDVRYPGRGAAPGPVRGSAGLGSGYLASSPLYSSLMWRTRQRAKELGYRFVWSRYGKILVKKDVQSPAMYILDEADLRKMG